MIKKINFSLKFKIVLIIALIISLAAFILSWFLLSHEREVMESGLKQRGLALGVNIAYNAEPGVLADNSLMLNDLLAGVLSQPDIIYCLITTNSGKILAEKGVNDKLKSLYLAKSGGRGLFVFDVINIQYINIVGIGKFYDVHIPIFSADSSKRYEHQLALAKSSSDLAQRSDSQIGKETQIGSVRLGISLAGVDAIGRSVKYTFTFLTLLIIIIFAGFSVGLSNILLRPVNKLLEGTKRVSEGDLNFKVRINSRDEIGQLADSFNLMTEQLCKTTVSRDYVDNIISSMAESLIVFSPEGTIKTVNQATSNMLGYTIQEFSGISIDKILAPELGFNNIDFFAADTQHFYVNKETYYLAKDKTRIPVLFSSSIMRTNVGVVEGIVCMAQDITELKNAQEKLRKAYEELKLTQNQLAQSEKMAGIGQLAAGVAHEINNPTGFILGNQDVLKKHVEITANILEQLKQLYQDASSLTIANGELLNNKIKALLSDTNFDYIKQDMYAIITETIEGALRIKNIVSALSGFIHPDRQIKKPEDISLIIDQALILVANEAKYKCDIEKHYETVEKIVCNRDQLIQVFVNLLINAIQSISGRGKIIIDLFCDDKFVCIRFTDTGIGIAAKNISRIFEPFFTTKDVGQGTGLGLAIVYNIIKAHNGLVDVVSQESRGSVFTVKLPK